MNEFTWEEQDPEDCEKGFRHMYILYQCTADSWCTSCKEYHAASVGAIQQFARGTYWHAHYWVEKGEVMVLPTKEEAQAWLLTVARMS